MILLFVWLSGCVSISSLGNSSRERQIGNELVRAELSNRAGEERETRFCCPRCPCPWWHLAGCGPQGREPRLPRVRFALLYLASLLRNVSEYEMEFGNRLSASE